MRVRATSRDHSTLRRVLRRGAPLVLLLACGGVARAEVDRQASEFFRAGEASYARGDFPAAARSFEEAHRRAPHAATLYNAGLAWELAKQPPRAADDYEAALKLGGLSASQAADATTRLGALERGLGHINVLAPRGGTISVAHLDQAPIPLVVHVAPGEHEVRIHRRSGPDETSRVAVAVGRSSDVTFSEEPPSPPTVTAIAAGATDAPAGPPAPRHRRAWGWAALGTSVGLGGVAIYLGVQALSARDTYNASDYTDLDAYDRAASLRTWTNVFWVGAGLAAATGVVLLLGDNTQDAASAPNQQRVSLGVYPGGASLTTTF